MRKAGDQEWAYAVAALLATVRIARANPRSSVGMVVLEALQTANAGSWPACEAILAHHKDTGRVVVFPALMLAARYAHEKKDLDRTIVLYAIRDAMNQIGLAVDDAEFEAAAQIGTGIGSDRA
jgi:hypothetical protein